MQGIGIMFVLGLLLFLSGFGFRYRKGVIHKKDRFLYGGAFSVAYFIYSLLAFPQNPQFVVTIAFILIAVNIFLLYAMSGLKGDRITILTSRWKLLSTDFSAYCKDNGLKVSVTSNSNTEKMRILSIKAKGSDAVINIIVNWPKENVPTHCTFSYVAGCQNSELVKALNGFLNKVRAEYPYESYKKERLFYIMGSLLTFIGVIFYR